MPKGIRVLIPEMRQAWNTGMKLKDAVSWLIQYDISKQEVVSFWKDCVDKYGFNGSIPEPKNNYYAPRQSRRDLISQYTSHTGMFGNYAEWCGNSVSYYLNKAGYEPLSEAEQKHYRTY